MWQTPTQVVSGQKNHRQVSSKFTPSHFVPWTACQLLMLQCGHICLILSRVMTWLLFATEMGLYKDRFYPVVDLMSDYSTLLYSNQLISSLFSYTYRNYLAVHLAWHGMPGCYSSRWLAGYNIAYQPPTNGTFNLTRPLCVVDAVQIALYLNKLGVATEPWRPWYNPIISNLCLPSTYSWYVLQYCQLRVR